jgi:hypothetical protein
VVAQTGPTARPPQGYLAGRSSRWQNEAGSGAQGLGGGQSSPDREPVPGGGVALQGGVRGRRMEQDSGSLGRGDMDTCLPDGRGPMPGILGLSGSSLCCRARPSMGRGCKGQGTHTCAGGEEVGRLGLGLKEKVAFPVGLE